MKPRLLDLFCGAGGCTKGYQRAGFYVVGVDNRPQPNYCGDEFVQGDALEWLAGNLDLNPLQPFGPPAFSALHASPPCQVNVKGMAAVNVARGRDLSHVDLIAPTRKLLEATGLPYAIENVEGAALHQPVKLCGSSFRLPIRRHRLFECSFPVLVPPCDHSWQNEAKYPTNWRPEGEFREAKVVQVYGNAAGTHLWADAMEIDWMTPSELAQAIPPVYTESIGCQLLSVVQAVAA